MKMTVPMINGMSTSMIASTAMRPMPRPGEDLLNQNDATHKPGDIHAGHRHDRVERVGQDVA